MKPASILANTDRTSWSRIAMVGRYFWPTLRLKVLLIPLFSLFVTIMAHLFGIADGNSLAITMLDLISWMLVLSPIMFAKQAADEVFCSLPALGCEKVAFVFLWSFIAVPFLLLAPPVIYAMIAIPETNNVAAIYDSSFLSNLFTLDAAGNIVTISILATLTTIAVGLWAVFGSRRNRTRNAVLAIVGTMMLNGFYGFVLGFISAWQRAKPGLITEDLSNTLNVFGPAMSLSWVIFLIFALWKASRAIARKQV